MFKKFASLQVRKFTGSNVGEAYSLKPVACSLKLIGVLITDLMTSNQ
jgi:hypothetical protein